MTRLPCTLPAACLLAIGAIHLLPLFSGVLVVGQEVGGREAIELTPPTGPMPLGRTSYHWADSPPTAAAEGDAACEVMVHLWYPAASTQEQETADYIPGFELIETAIGKEHLRDEAGPAYAGLSSAKTHVVADAQLSSESPTYPVLLLAHGLRFSSLGYSMLCEELASHGYVVVGVDQPATAMAVLFPEKRVARFDEARWTEHKTREETLAFEQQQVNRCAQEFGFVLDQLQRLQSGMIPSQFQGRLDLDRVGIIGHSFGGRVAARACQLDSRLNAGAILDSFGRTMTVERKPDGSTMEQPIMLQYAKSRAQ